MERPTVVIISDEPEFSAAATRRWLAQRNAPSFRLADSLSCRRLRGDFDLAVAGGLKADSLSSVLHLVQKLGRPVVCVSRLNGHSPQAENVISLPEIPEWPDLLITVGNQVLERDRAVHDLSRLIQSSFEREQQAALGRYVLEVRHNLNNALTSILGNSDLILLDGHELSSGARAQVETIRNMGMRMNEILHRFSSLQKEMQLVEQQSYKNNAKRSAGAGA